MEPLSVIDNCPAAVTVIVTIETGEFDVTVDLNLTVSADMSNSTTFMASGEQLSPTSLNVLSGVAIDENGTSVTVMINGDTFNTEVAPSAVFNISVEAMDENTTALCVVLVTVEFEEAEVCDLNDVRSDGAQAAGTSNAVQQLNAVEVGLIVTEVSLLCIMLVGLLQTCA